MTERIGYMLYCDRQPFAACANQDQRRGWIRAQHEATQSRIDENMKRGRTGDAAPDWWLEEMAS